MTRRTVLIALIVLTPLLIGTAGSSARAAGTSRPLGPYDARLVISEERVELLLDDADGPAVTEGLQGSILFFKGAVRHGRLRLRPAAPGRMVAVGRVHRETGVDAVVYLRLRDGSSVRARFP